MNVSVAVTQNTEGTRFFHGAGKVQASSLPQDMRLQRMLGHASALACKNPDKISDVLVIACGAGVTAGSFMTYPNIKNITICDIEPLVPKVAAQMFGKENYHIVDGIEKQNPRYANGKKITVVYDDGRHYINTLSENIKFDVITSDPIDPWVKGTAALNTIEFYEKCKKHLKPGGTMSLWMPLYESSMASAKSMIGTFFLAFRNGMIFSNDQNFEGYDAVLLGQTEPSTINVDYLQALLAKDEYRKVRESLVEVGFGQESSQNFNGNPDPAINLLATYAARASDLDQWTRRAQINHDRDLRLQYLAGMGFNSAIGTTILQNITACYHFPSDVFIGSSATLNDLKLALASGGRR
jgi:spermidine synthase